MDHRFLANRELDDEVLDLELRELTNAPSDYFDGLSFSQGEADANIVTSDRFAAHTLIHEPQDTIAFAKGAVGHGEIVVFTMTVTHASPDGGPVYLLQRPNARVERLSMRPAPHYYGVAGSAHRR